MADATTVYDIKVNYLLNDKASKQMGKLRAQAKGTGRAFDMLSGSINRLIGLAAVGFGFKKATDFLIGYNIALKETQAKLRTTIQLTSRGAVSFGEANKRAAAMMKELTERAKASPGTRAEMAEFASFIAPAAQTLGATDRTLLDLAQGGLVAGVAFGERPDVAARDIKQMLTAQTGARDPLANVLLASAGLTPEEWNAFVKNARKREGAKGNQRVISAMRAILTQDAIQQAADSYKKSFTGVFSTFKSNLQEFGGAAGKLLFGAINKELIKLNAWFEKNPGKLKKAADSIARSLKDAFDFAKNAFSFIIKHKDLFMSLAKAAIAAKIGGGIGSFVSGLSGMGGRITQVTTAFGALAASAVLLTDMFARRQEQAQKNVAEARPLTDLLFKGERTPIDQRRIVQFARQRGVFKPGEPIDEDRLTTLVLHGTGIGGDFHRRAEQAVSRVRQARAAVGDMPLTWAQRFREQRLWALAEKEWAGGGKNLVELPFEDMVTRQALLEPRMALADIKKQAKGAEVKINKMEINVQADDPTRFAIGLEGVFGDLARNPSQAITAIREGF